MTLILRQYTSWELLTSMHKLSGYHPPDAPFRKFLAPLPQDVLHDLPTGCLRKFIWYAVLAYKPHPRRCSLKTIRGYNKMEGQKISALEDSSFLWPNSWYHFVMIEVVRKQSQYFGRSMLPPLLRIPCVGQKRRLLHECCDRRVKHSLLVLGRGSREKSDL